MEQNIRLDVNHMMADMLGGEYGVTQAQLAAMQDAAVKAQHAVEANRGTGWLGWMNLPYNQEEIVSEIEKVAEHVRKTFKYFVVLGIGGSALGPIAVHQALNHLHYNELPDSKRPGPKFYVEDNIVACYFKAGHYTDDSAQAFVILKALLKAGTVPPVKVLADDLIAWVESMNGFEINLLGPSSKASLLAHSRGEDYTKYTKLSLTNGAGMRIAPVGCLVDWNDTERLAETVARVSIVTHGTDVAIGGAAMVAQAVASGIGGCSWEEAAEDVLRIWDVARAKGESTWAASVAERFRLALSVMKDFDDDEKFSRWVYDILGTGTMTSESVSAALAVAFYCRSAERAAIMCANMGGDTDTIGAMACAICGAFEGFDALPESRSSFLETTNALDFRAMAAEIARARTTFHL